MLEFPYRANRNLATARCIPVFDGQKGMARLQLEDRENLRCR